MDKDFKLRSGKYLGKTIAWLQENNPSYLEWVKANQPNMLEGSDKSEEGLKRVFKTPPDRKIESALQPNYDFWDQPISGNY